MSPERASGGDRAQRGSPPTPSAAMPSNRGGDMLATLSATQHTRRKTTGVPPPGDNGGPAAGRRTARGSADCQNSPAFHHRTTLSSTLV